MTDDGAHIGIGNTAEIHLRDGKIVKIFGNADIGEARIEAGKQQYVRSRGVNVPEVFDVITVEGKPAIVMEHIPGVTMLEAIGDDMAKFEHFISKSIAIQLKLHAVDAPGLPSMLDKLARQIERAVLVPDLLKTELISRVDGIGDSSQLCHGDFHIQNLIVNGDDVSIIDWMDATAGNPLLDACRSYVLYGSVSNVAADIYLKEYCTQTDISPDEITRWVPVIAAARLSENIDTAEQTRLLQMALEG